MGMPSAYKMHSPRAITIIDHFPVVVELIRVTDAPSVFPHPLDGRFLFPNTLRPPPQRHAQHQHDQQQRPQTEAEEAAFAFVACGIGHPAMITDSPSVIPHFPNKLPDCGMKFAPAF